MVLKVGRNKAIISVYRKLRFSRNYLGKSSKVRSRNNWPLRLFLTQSDSASRKRPFSTGLFLDWIILVLFLIVSRVDFIVLVLFLEVV